MEHGTSIKSQPKLSLRAVAFLFIQKLQKTFAIGFYLIRFKNEFRLIEPNFNNNIVNRIWRTGAEFGTDQNQWQDDRSYKTFQKKKTVHNNENVT